MSKPKAHIVVATPTYTGDVCSDYSTCLMLAGMHCFSKQVLVDHRVAPGFSLVEYARNWLVAEFLSVEHATHLFWIDSDLYFQPASVYKMVDRGLDVVAGVYTTKNEQSPIYPYMALGPVKDGLQEAERVPGGYLCMSRKAVEAVVAKCKWHKIDHNGETRMAPRFFDLSLRGEELVGEDFIACERLRDAGFKIYVETDVSFKHYGRKAWPANLARTLDEEREAGFKGQGTSKAWKKNSELLEKV